MLCARCAWSRRRVPDCPDCGSRELVPLAAGTRRLADELGRSMDGPVAALEGHAAEAPAPPAVLVTTRGSVLDAPPGPVGAVVLPDVDTQVRRPRLDASEDALRLSMRAASWVVHPDGRVPDRPASRGEPPPAGGDPVVVQTREPDAPVVQALVAWDPGGFWRREAATRAELGFPPATTAVRIRADAEEADELDRALRGALPGADRVLGPAVRDGRAGWLIKAAERGPSLAAIAELRRQRSEAGSDPWVEVDPVGEL